MRGILVVKKTTILRYLLLFLLIAAFFFTKPAIENALSTNYEKNQWEEIIRTFFERRNNCLLAADTQTLESMYLTSEQNGLWAFENEKIRLEYLQNWAVKQGIAILRIQSCPTIRSIKQVGRGYAFYIAVVTEYQYRYSEDPDAVNTFKIGTYHSLDLIPGSEEDSWIISREWYTDPLSDSLDITAVPEEVTEFIAAHASTDSSGITEQRKAAVQYADTYWTAGSDGQNTYEYNSAYTNYNSLGGDCANFLSQVLYESGGFKKNSYWNYRGAKGSRAWINAQNFKNYLLYGGRASLIASGDYLQVYTHAYALLPGDIIAYAKKGKITHVSLVTGWDSKGYPLVNCHNTDRYKVPWDLGWSEDGITFYLLRVNY